MGDPPCCSQSCGKRSRSGEEIILPGIVKTDDEPRSKIQCVQKAADDSTAASSSWNPPLAPSLKAFIEPGGSTKYLPRPEWYIDPNSTKVQKSDTFESFSPETDLNAVGGLPVTPFRFFTEHLESEFTFLPISENTLSAEAAIAKDQTSLKTVVFGKDVSSRAMRV